MTALILGIVAARFAIGGFGCALSCWLEARKYRRQPR